MSITLTKPQLFSKTKLMGWFTPRTTNPNLIFREKTLRILLAVLIAMVVVAFIASETLWDGGVYPLAELITGLFFIVAAIAVHRGHVTESGYMTVAGFLFFSTFLVATGGNSANFVTNYMFCIVVIALVTPRNAIIPSAIVSTLLMGIITFINMDSGAALRLTSNSLLILLMLAVLLYLLRAEFDNRLLATEAARRETEQALQITQSARQEAEEANMAKTRFLSTMSHELRTPLGAIIGYVGILQSNMIKDKSEAIPLSKTQKEYLASIRSNSDHLLGLINGVLDLAKISSGRMQPLMTTISPTDPTFIVGTINDLKSLAITKGIELDLQFDPKTPPEVRCDPMQLKQVVKNLVANSIKFTREGRVAVHVEPVENKSAWKITVSDTGVGIKPDALEHVFEPFYQADSSDTRNYEGTGLGLAITKSFVEAHKGTIQVHSTLGKGTRFDIQLPC